MENPNPSPSKDSTNKTSPLSSPQRPPSDHDSPTATNLPIEGSQRERIEGGIILKTPEEVLAELTAGDDEIAGGDDGAGAGASAGAGVLGGGSMMVAREVGGRLVVEGGGGINDGLMRKRKNTQVKDPPSGKPICPECYREFSTWKAAFGHMRKHPGRTHRGFYPPPSFSAESTTTVPPKNDGEGGDKGVAVASLVQRLVFDLNQSLEGGAGSSDAAERQQARPAEDGGKKMPFDLNESPPPEEDE